MADTNVQTSPRSCLKIIAALMVNEAGRRWRMEEQYLREADRAR